MPAPTRPFIVAFEAEQVLLGTHLVHWRRGNSSKISKSLVSIVSGAAVSSTVFVERAFVGVNIKLYTVCGLNGITYLEVWIQCHNILLSVNHIYPQYHLSVFIHLFTDIS